MRRLPDLDVELEANVVRPVAEGVRAEWEYVMWTGGTILLGPGAHPTAPGPATPAE